MAVVILSRNKPRFVKQLRYIKGEGLYIEGEGPFYTKSGISVADIRDLAFPVEVTVTLLVDNLGVNTDELLKSVLDDQTESLG